MLSDLLLRFLSFAQRLRVPCRLARRRTSTPELCTAEPCTPRGARAQAQASETLPWGDRAGDRRGIYEGSSVRLKSTQQSRIIGACPDASRPASAALCPWRLQQDPASPLVTRKFQRGLRTCAQCMFAWRHVCSHGVSVCSRWRQRLFARRQYLVRAVSGFCSARRVSAGVAVELLPWSCWLCCCQTSCCAGRQTVVLPAVPFVATVLLAATVLPRSAHCA
jgi:hypothetical protein